MISEPGFEERGIVDRVDEEDETISVSGNNLSKENIHGMFKEPQRTERAWRWPSFHLATERTLRFTNGFEPGTVLCSGDLEPWLPTGGD